MNILTERYSVHLTEQIVIEPYSQRIKVYTLPTPNEMESILSSLKTVAAEYHCDKLIFYVKDNEKHLFPHDSYVLEGKIAVFFSRKRCFYLCPVFKRIEKRIC